MAAFLIPLGAAMAVSGCVQVTAGPGPSGVGVVFAEGVKWTWFDPNLLRRPGLFCERIEHRPPPADRVRHFRWQHGAGADDPLLRPIILPVDPLPPAGVVLEPPLIPLTPPGHDEPAGVAGPASPLDDAAIPPVPAPVEIDPESWEVDPES